VNRLCLEMATASSRNHHLEPGIRRSSSQGSK